MKLEDVEVGQTVQLRAEPDEGWDEEAGTVLGVQVKATGDVIVTVEVFDQYHLDEHDTGLREVTLDQIMEETA